MDKKTIEKHEKILNELVQQEENKYCADCGEKGTRWASWNIGVFLCIRCGGLHRRLGTHISRVKSVNLDSWTSEQVESIQSKGNKRVNAVYNPHPEKHPFPSYEGEMEQYIREKYERKLFMNEESGRSENGRSENGRSENRRSDNGRNSGSISAVSEEHRKYSSELGKLRDMGFNDMDLAVKALQAAKGNVPLAIDYLVAAGSSMSSSSSKVENRATAQSDNRQTTLSSEEQVALHHFKAMGFTDDVMNLRILRQCQGKLNEAISTLVNMQQKQAIPQQSSLKNVEKKESVMDDLFSLDPAPSNPFNSQTSVQNSFNKNDILSLYGNSTSNPFAPRQDAMKIGNANAFNTNSLNSNNSNSFNPNALNCNTLNSNALNPNAFNSNAFDNIPKNETGFSSIGFNSALKNETGLNSMGSSKNEPGFSSMGFNSKNDFGFNFAAPSNNNSIASSAKPPSSSQSNDPFKNLTLANPFKPQSPIQQTNSFASPVVQQTNAFASPVVQPTNSFAQFGNSNVKSTQPKDPFDSLI